MRLTRNIFIGVFGLVCLTGNAMAVNVVIDYSYDTTNFFGAGNPDGAVAGQQARDALEAAADYFSGITNDSFAGISTPAPLISQFGDGVWTWSWQSQFSHPTTGVSTYLDDPTIQPDQYLIYAGARSLGGDTAGRGGVGGRGPTTSDPIGGFTQAEIDLGQQTTNDFFSDVTTRGQANGFSSWGGSITFDNDGSTTWWYDHTSAPANNTFDFFSVAIHELAHALGSGSTEWEALVTGAVNNYSFSGAASTSVFGSTPPVANDKSHWAAGTMSTVYGGTTAQEAAMDPDITDGTRKHFTALDAAGLTDIGWDLTPPVATLIGDLDGDGFVGIADLNIVLGNWNQSVSPGVWLDGDPSGDGYVGIDDLNAVLGNWNAGTPPTVNAIPEPASALMMGLTAAGLLGRKRRN